MPDADVRNDDGSPRDQVLQGPDRESLLLLSQLPDPSQAPDGWNLLQTLKVLLATRQSLSWQAGRALDVLWWDGYHAEIGFPSFREYVDDELGMAEGRAATLRRLDRDLRERPALRDAYRQGRLGWCKSWLVLRATRGCPETAEPWVEHARRVSFRRLDMEVRALRALRALSETRWWTLTRGLPPTPEFLRELKMLPGGYRPPEIDALERLATENADVRNDEGSRKAHRILFRTLTIVFRAPPEVHAFYRRTVSGMKRLFGPKYGIIGEERCLITLMAHFVETHLQGDGDIFHLDKVYDRDVWRCTFPGCGGRVLEDHHGRWRSAGGGDERSNREAVCVKHHRHAIHEGRARMEGEAPHALTFKVGRREDGTFREVWRDDERVDDGP